MCPIDKKCYDTDKNAQCLCNDEKRIMRIQQKSDAVCGVQQRRKCGDKVQVYIINEFIFAVEHFFMKKLVYDYHPMSLLYNLFYHDIEK